MKNRAKTFVQTILLSAVLFGFSSCLDPISLLSGDGSLKVEGNFTVTDITSAVLLISNVSKTVDVKHVYITYDASEWDSRPENYGQQKPWWSFTERPRALERRAQYLPPSDITYSVSLSYRTREGLEGQGEITVPLPLPREVVAIYVYRNQQGEVIIGRELLNPDPADTAEPRDDPLLGEGSSPAIIPPENRTQMATYVVVNRSSSQIIDGVSFKASDGRSYSMGPINVRDRQSIALGQGTWETTVNYTINRLGVTTGAKNAVVVPSNDPQAIREHYMNFYKTTREHYELSQEWPPYPDDSLAEDLLPPDRWGQGRGALRITNNTEAIVTGISIHNLRRPELDPLYLDYEDHFSPSRPITYGKTGYVEVIGIPQEKNSLGFPIEPHHQYLAQIDLESAAGSGSVERLVYLYDHVYEIILNPWDLNIESTVGAVITLVNGTSGDSAVAIMGLIVRNSTDRHYATSYDSNSWGESQGTPPGYSSSVLVLSSIGMPILPGARFEAELLVRRLGGPNEGETLKIRKEIYPAALHPGLHPDTGLPNLRPDQNLRSITLNSSDIEDPTGNINLGETITLRIFHTGLSARALQRLVFVEEPVSTYPSVMVNRTGKTGVPFATAFHESRKWGTGTNYFNNNIVIGDDPNGPRQRLTALVDAGTAHVISLAKDVVNSYVDVTVPMPKKGYGYVLYFGKKELGYMIGYSRSGLVNPVLSQNVGKFWFNPWEIHLNAANPDLRKQVYMDGATVLGTSASQGGVLRYPIWYNADTDKVHYLNESDSYYGL
ncbi:MAG: hypothetical protein FWH12_02540 [Treponema sp.]|nr:hypothetical protein [Treponema sp.]